MSTAGTLVWGLPLILKSMSSNASSGLEEACANTGAARNRKGEGSQDLEQLAHHLTTTATCHSPSSSPVTPAPHTPNLGESLQSDFQTEEHTIRENTEEMGSSLALRLGLSPDLEIRNSSWDH